MNQKIYIVGASAEQRIMLEVIKEKHNLPILFVGSLREIKSEEAKQIENPFAPESLKLLNCYEVLEDYRDVPLKDEIREKRNQFENRSRYLSRMKYNKKNR